MQKKCFEAQLPTVCAFLQRMQALHEMNKHTTEENRDFLEKAAGLILDISSQYCYHMDVKQSLS